MNKKIVLAVLAMSLIPLMFIGHVSALPYGIMNQVADLKMPDIWTLTSSPDARIWGGTSGGFAGSLLFYYLPLYYPVKTTNCPRNNTLVVLGPPQDEVYSLTTTVCGNMSYEYTPNATSTPYWVIGGSYMANPAFDAARGLPPHGAHLFEYLPDMPWAPGINPFANNPCDLGAWHRLPGGPGLPADSLMPMNTMIYKLSAGPCGKVYGGSGWDMPYNVAGFGDYAYFFVFDPVSEKILFWKFYPMATSVIDVLAGRDGNVWFITQYDNPNIVPRYSVLSYYNPKTQTVTPWLDSRQIGNYTFMFTCITWCYDHYGNQRIYIGAQDLNTGNAYLIQVNPFSQIPAPYWWVSPTSIGDPAHGVQLGFVRDLTTGLTEMVYGVGYGTVNQTSCGLFFFYRPCKPGPAGVVPDPIWGDWAPSWSAATGNPWIAGTPWQYAPLNTVVVARLRTIVTGQEAQNGYCVQAQNPCIYMGAGGGSSQLFEYWPITPDTDNSGKAGLVALSRLASQFNFDPPEEAGSLLNPAVIAIAVPAAIIAGAAVYRQRRRKIAHHSP